ncbi:hypothetical protein [Pseudomonas aeruginosa]
MMKRNVIDRSGFNPNVELPYDLRLIDFEHAMQDVYDFFADVNTTLAGKGLQRMDDMTRPAIMSGFISDMITATLAKSSRTLVENNYFNGHPDLVVRGIYENDSVKSGSEGVEIKSTRKDGGAVDTHGARAQWMCVFVYEIDNVSQPVRERFPMQFTEVYLSYVTVDDFRRNDRGELGTRTATLHAEGVKKLREGWVYKAPSHGLKAKR